MLDFKIETLDDKPRLTLGEEQVQALELMKSFLYEEFFNEDLN